MAKKAMEYTEVISQKELSKDIFDLWIKTEEIAGQALPGQFLSVYLEDGGRLLPRPISICEINKEENAIRLVYRVTGKQAGTSALSKKEKGSNIKVLGPLGNGFLLLDKKALLIGGGIGVPPMLELAKQLSNEKILVMGYRDSLFLTEEMEQNGNVFIATEDGSAGTKGNVLDVIREKNITADVIYACGPTPMLRAVAEYAKEKGILCYLSMEERMACGIGACLACVCQSKETDHHSNVKNKRICKDGPVFLATEVELS